MDNHWQPRGQKMVSSRRMFSQRSIFFAIILLLCVQFLIYRLTSGPVILFADLKNSTAPELLQATEKLESRGSANRSLDNTLTSAPVVVLVDQKKSTEPKLLQTILPTDKLESHGSTDRSLVETQTSTTIVPIQSCFQVMPTDGHELLEDVQQASVQPSAEGRNIFFHETSCSTDGLVRLTARQACAIESAARINPDWNIFILFAAPVGFATNNSTSNGTTLSPIIKSLLEYRNVHWRFVNLTTYANGTPLEEWMRRGEVYRSEYMNSHLSDVMRYLSLFKYGGTYLDLDVIVLRPFGSLEPNYAGAESDELVAAGVLNFEPTGHGHELAELCVRYLLANFNGTTWNANGPDVITRVLQKYCETKKTVHMTRERCRNFTVYPPNAFYAIYYPSFRLLFEEHYLKEALAKVNQSSAVHVWDKLSYSYPVTVGSRVAYGVLADQYCPTVYHSCGTVF